MESSNPVSGMTREHSLDSLQACPSSITSSRTGYSWKLLLFFARKQHIGVLSAAVSAAALVAALRTFLSVALGRIFNVVSQLGQGARTGQSALTDVSTWCIVLVGLGIGSWMANGSFLSLWIVFGELQAREARRLVFASLLSKRPEWFAALKDGVEGLHTRIHTQVRDFQLATSEVLGFVISDMIASSASLGIALYYSWKLALVLLTTLPISFIILCVVTRNVDAEIWLQKQCLQKASTSAAAAVNGIDLVTVYAGHDREVSKYASALKLAARHFLIQVRCNSIQMGYIAFWSISVFVLGFWYGLLLVENGLPPGNVVTTFHAIITAFQGIEALARHWIVLSKGKGAVFFLSDLTKSEEWFEAPAAKKHQEIIGDVRLEKVNFAYESNPGKNCLTEASLHFPAKRMTFLIGDSGSGKSTVCSLIASLLTPVDGKVLFDGCPVQQLCQSCLRRQVALVQQNSPVIHDTFFNNVALGHTCLSKVTTSDILQACEFAQLESLVLNLRFGLSTVVSSDGHTLSGGQRQKLALARVWLRDPAVLIMDEPTGALDPVSQFQLMAAIRRWRQDKTTIVVTHDLSNIEDQDFVYILKNGSVFRQGRMRELRHVAAVFCSPEGKRTSNHRGSRDNLTASSNTMQQISQPSRTYSGQYSRISLHNAFGLSLTAKTDNCYDRSSRSFQTNCRKSVERPLSMGWQLSSHCDGTHQQFSDYLDRHFETPAADGEPHQDWLIGLKYGKTRTTEKIATERPIVDEVEFACTETESQDDSMPSTHVSTGKDCGSLNRRVESLLGIISTVWPSIAHRDRITLIFATVLCLVTSAATPAFSYCLSQLLSAMWSQTGKEEGARWALYLVGIAVVHGLSTGAAHYIFDRVSQTWIDNLRKEAFGKVLEQPRSWFQKSHATSAQISQCLDRNAQEMRTILGKMVPVAIIVLAITSTSIIWAMAICWKLTLVTLAPLPFIIFAVKVYSVVSSIWERRCNDAASNSSAMLKEALLNFEFVRVFALESYFGGKQASAADQALRVGLKKSLYTGPLFGLYQSIIMPLTSLVFYYGTLTVATDSKTNVGEILQVINLLLFCIGTTFELLNGLPELAVSKQAAADFLEYVRLPKTTQPPQHWPSQPSSPLPIQMYNLDFTPDQFSPKVLDGLSLGIDPGQSLAIVGASGSGKSTTLSLLLGINTPDQSSLNEAEVDWSGLSFGNVALPSIDMNYLRSTMAYVPQKPFLFPATIAENIAYGIHSASSQSVQESVIQAAKAAGIHDFIVSLPNAYETVVGDAGQPLSGGQSQLVNIARALARKPKLLVLDEPTSSLDADSAATVRSAILALIRSPDRRSRGMAVVVATHCVKMMQVVDEVVLLDAGSNVEQGTYSSLVAGRGALWRLVHYNVE